jgi:hypothetical protein
MGLTGAAEQQAQVVLNLRNRADPRNCRAYADKLST